MPMAFYVIMPDEHVEWMALCADRLRQAYDNRVPRNFREQEEMERCRSAEEFLIDCSKEILARQRRIIGYKGVSKVYFENRENNLTKELYDGCLDGKDIVWIRGDFESDVANQFAKSGRTDPVYDFYQDGWEKNCPKVLEDNPPAPNTAGVAIIGPRHVDYVANALAKDRHTVKVLEHMDYKSKIDDRLRELGIDVDSIRVSAIL